MLSKSNYLNCPIIYIIICLYLSLGATNTIHLILTRIKFAGYHQALHSDLKDILQLHRLILINNLVQDNSGLYKV